jgi:hypothetical protein
MMAKRVEDVGEHVGGSRKDKWRERALVLSDLSALSVREAEHYVTKDLVWPEPDYAKLIEGGMQAEAAALLKLVRNAVAAAPTLTQHVPNTREVRPAADARADYVRILGVAQDELRGATSVSEIREACRRIPFAIGMDRHGRADRATANLLTQAFKTGSRTGPFQISGTTVARAARMVEVEGFPGKQAAWRKGLTTFQSPKDGDRWLAYNKARVIVASGFATEDELLDHLREAYALKRAKAKEGPQKPTERAHCPEVVRSGLPDRRGGRSISSQEFMDTFGFKNVQFGEWVPHYERQWMMDIGYDSLLDLSEVLGIDPGNIGFGGMLSAAFGSRGSGKAAAHYESTETIFNMTRTNGAGSLAHEYAHALDDVIGQIGRPGDGGVSYASGGIDRPRPRMGDLPGLGDAEAAVVGLMDRIFVRPKSRGESVRGLAALSDAAAAEVVRVRAMMDEHAQRPRGEQNAKWLRKCAAYCLAKEALSKRLLAQATAEAGRPATDDFGTTDTEFRKEARLLSGETGYNSHPTELLARAFESAVFDALAERGGRSDYLVYGVEADRYADKKDWVGNPYPTGEERAGFLAGVRALAAAVAEPVAEFSRENAARANPAAPRA